MFDDMYSSWHSCASAYKHVCATLAAYAPSVSPNLTLLLAERIRELMRLRDWSQEETAKRASVSRRAVGYLVNYRDRGDRHPTLETVEGLASAFHMPAWKLLAPDDAADAQIAEPEPLDVELLTTVLAESADVFRSFNVMPSFEQLAATAVRMYNEVQTGIPMRRAAQIVAQQLEQVQRGTNLALNRESLRGDAQRGQGNPGAHRRGKTRTR